MESEAHASKPLDWQSGIPVAALRAYLTGLKDDDLVSPLLFKSSFPIAGLAGKRDPGFISRDDGASCCETNLGTATVHAIEHKLVGDQIEVAVTASHPCGIKRISIFLGSYELLPAPGQPGGRVRQPRVRSKNDGSLYEETWSRSDSHDGRPVTLPVVFPKNALIPIWNCWIIRITDSCDRIVEGHTGEFDIPS